MNKNLLLAFILFACSISAFSQSVPLDWSPWEKSETGQYSYQTITELPGVKEEEMFKNINVWAAQNFKNSNYSVQLADKENWIFIANASTFYIAPVSTYSCDCTMSFSLKAEFKEGRARVTFDDINIADGSIKRNPDQYKKGLAMNGKYIEAVRSNSLDVSLKLMDEINKAIGSKKEDW